MILSMNQTPKSGMTHNQHSIENHACFCISWCYSQEVFASWTNRECTVLRGNAYPSVRFTTTKGRVMQERLASYSVVTLPHFLLALIWLHRIFPLHSPQRGLKGTMTPLCQIMSRRHC